MARVGITITKNVLFRGVQQEFHNTYYYQDALAVTTPAEGLIDEIVALEKAWHGNTVNFQRGQAWSAGGTIAQNQMLFQKNLSGVGSSGAVTAMDRERAFLIRWPAGFDIRGLPVYLRKWFHTCGGFGNLYIPANDVLANQAEIPGASRTAIANAVAALDDIGNAEAWTLCSKGGRMRQGSAQAHRYLEHHQLGDQWR